MSNRTLIELNHDYADEICQPEMIAFLRYYLNCAGKKEIEALDRLTKGGLRVISLRHHADRFYIDDKTDGFPAIYTNRTLLDARR